MRRGPYGGASSSPPSRTPSSPAGSMAGSRDRAARHSQPREQRRLGTWPPDANLLLADPRPAARELEPASRRVRAHAMSETTARAKSSGQLVVAQLVPLGAVDDQPVGDTDEAVGSTSPKGGSPRQRRNTGRSEIEERAVRATQACARGRRGDELDHLAANGRSPTGKQRTDSSASTPPGSSGSGTRMTVRDGWRSRHSLERPLGRLEPAGRHPGNVGHHTRALMRRARPRLETSRSGPARRRCRRS